MLWYKAYQRLNARKQEEIKSSQATPTEWVDLMCVLWYFKATIYLGRRITVHMVLNPSICFPPCHWSIPVQRDWPSPRALAHNPWPISQWGVKTLHNLNMHINSQRFVNITELMVDLGPRTQPGLNRCIYPAVHRCFENSSRKICFFKLCLSCVSISNIKYVNTGLMLVRK